MLDVHPPEHGIHGVRDFLLHLLTITVGLLIAISLEQSVEAVHHRHQRREAEETIHRELLENRDTLTRARTGMTLEQKNLVMILDYLQARLQNRTADAAGLNLQFSEGALQDAAWRTANTTGVTTYMDYTQVQLFSAAYKEQAQFEEMEQQALLEYLQLDSFVVRGFDPKSVTTDDMKAALPVVRTAIADVGGMLDISRGTLEAYTEALKDR
jgi:hypothetical protein